MVGVSRIVALVSWLALLELGLLGLLGSLEEEEDEEERCMSGRLTTAREPRERGCSGSVMGAIRSVYI